MPHKEDDEMNALFQLHWSLHRSTLLISFALIALFTVLFYDRLSALTNLTLAITISASSARMSFELLKHNNRLLLYALPISRKTIIKSVYLVNFIICTACFLIVVPAQIYTGLLHDSLFTYVFAWSGFYCGCLLGTLFFIIVYLDDAKSDKGIVALFTLVAGFAVAFVPHTMLSFFLAHPLKWLLLAITPTSVLIAYYLLMQHGAKKFARREPL